MMRRRKVPMTAEEAEALGARALLFLAEDDHRLMRFLRETGLEPAVLQTGAGSPEVLRSVLAHLLADESTLLVFTTSAGLEPEAVTAAHSRLEAAAARSG
jgi:fructoselysine-6-P-deglycase FrlB-like protein